MSSIREIVIDMYEEDEKNAIFGSLKIIIKRKISYIRSRRISEEFWTIKKRFWTYEKKTSPYHSNVIILASSMLANFKYFLPIVIEK